MKKQAIKKSAKKSATGEKPAAKITTITKDNLNIRLFGVLVVMLMLYFILSSLMEPAVTGQLIRSFLKDDTIVLVYTTEKFNLRAVSPNLWRGYGDFSSIYRTKYPLFERIPMFTSNNEIAVYEDGKPMQGVFNLVVFRKTPGSFYVSNDKYLYIYPSDGKNIRDHEIEIQYTAREQLRDWRKYSGSTNAAPAYITSFPYFGVSQHPMYASKDSNSITLYQNNIRLKMVDSQNRNTQKGTFSVLGNGYIVIAPR